MYFQNIVIHVAYHNNKFTDLYIIGEKKKKKNRIKTNLSQLLSEIYRNL